MKIEEIRQAVHDQFGVSLSADTLERTLAELSSRKDELRAKEKCKRTNDSCAPLTFDEESRSVEVVIATETPVLRYDWWDERFYDEVLSMDGVTIPERGIPFIRNHASYSTDNIIGRTDGLRVEGDKLVGVRHFSSLAEREFTLAREGCLIGQSVGYRISERVKVKRGESAEVNGKTYTASEERDLVVATRWSPLEDSAVVLPADCNTGMRSSVELENESQRRKAMDDDEKKAADPKTQAQTVPNDDGEAGRNAMTEQERNAVREQERRRISEIDEIARNFAIDEAVRDKAMNEGMSVDEFRKVALEEIHRRSMSSHSPSTASVGETEYERRRDALVDCLLFRAGLIDESQTHEGFREMYRSDRGIVLNYAKMFLDQHGVRYANSEPAEEIFRRAIATGDFPDLLMSTIKRSLKQGWETLGDENYTEWTSSASASDFRAQTVVSAMANIDLKEVKEGGEYEYSSMVSDKLSFSVAKYGRKVAFTWEALINDDLSQLTVIPEALARGYRKLEADLAYNFLINNPDFEDGVPLFHASHGNLAATGAAPSESALNAVNNAMALQRDKAGNFIRIVPGIIIAPLSLRQTITKLLDSERFVDGEAVSSQVNTVYRAYSKRIYEPRLDQAFAGQAQPYFVIGQPRYGVKIVHLTGYESPSVMSKDSFDIDGMETKIRHVAGAYAESYQALYKQPGVAI